MHGKYPHYLATGKPIIALTPKDSFIEKSIETTKSGFSIDINSDIPASLHGVFMSIINNGFPSRNNYEIEKFSMDNFKKAWIEIISEA